MGVKDYWPLCKDGVKKQSLTNLAGLTCAIDISASIHQYVKCKRNRDFAKKAVCGPFDKTDK